MQEPVLGSNRDEPKGVSLFPSYRAAAANTTPASRAPGAESIVLRKQPSALEVLAIGGIGIAVLYFGRDVFMPLALAILLSFALAPLVLLLRRWHFNRVLSVVGTVFLAFLIIFGIGALIGSQLAQLADDIPQYQTNIIEKVRAFRGTGAGVIDRAAALLKNVGEMSKPEATDNTAAVPPAGKARGGQRLAPPEKPTPVELREPERTPLQILQNVGGPLLQPLATIGIVIIFVIFVLLQREDLRDRFIRLAGPRDLKRTTEALDDAAQRVSRYLLMQTVINICFGVLIGAGLWLIGAPNPVLCGVMAMLLRFIPYIGPFIALVVAAAIALAVDPGWSMVLWTVGLFLVAEPVTGQIIEPLLYGQSTGLSPIAVIVAAAFWMWLWGPIGLLLSTPLTVCLVVLGRHVEYLQFIDVLLGDEPALTPEESFYQAMLAEHPDEAAHQAEEMLKDMSLAAYYDEVAIKGLALAQLDVNRGALDHECRIRIKGAVDDVIDDLSDHRDVVASTGNEESKEQTVVVSPLTPTVAQEEIVPATRKTAVLCVAGRGSLDEAAAAMLGQLLGNSDIAVRIVPREAAVAANLFRLDVEGIQMACLSYLEPGDLTNARYLVRRLRRKMPGVKILIGFWTLTEEEAERRAVLKETGADAIVTSLQQAIEHIGAVASETSTDLARM
jgi:predicted PurR-regulated permease PerM